MYYVKQPCKTWKVFLECFHYSGYRALKRGLVSAAFFSAIVLIFRVSDISAAACCATGGSGGGGNYGGISSAPLLDDSVKYNIFLYGLMSRSLSFNGLEGDPLGTGGQIPFFLNNNLYRESTPEAFSLIDDDNRLSYGDFGYIPFWKPNVLSSMLTYRLSEELQSAISMYLGGRQERSMLNDDGVFGIDELALVWTPSWLSGLVVRAGKILDTDYFASIFDMLPLTYICMKGMSFSWKTYVRQGIETGFQLSVGANLFGKSTVMQEERFLFRATRARSYLYGKLFLRSSNELTATVVGGIQRVGADSTVYEFSFSDGEKTRTFPESGGWHAGMGVSKTALGGTHSITVHYLRGDAVVGMYSPDYVLIDDENLRFTKMNSSLANIVYWTEIKTGRMFLSGGLQALLRFPSDTSVVQRNRNINFTPFPDKSKIEPDSLIILNEPADSMLSLGADPLYSLRLAMNARFSITKAFCGGARIDYLHYLTPDARANTQDLLRDQAMRPVADPDYPGLQERLYVQSRWENEAVNAMILSPFIMVDFKDLGSIQLAYSHGFYKKPVVRHGTINTQHANISIIANVVLSKTGLLNVKTSVLNSIKMKQPEPSRLRNSHCPVMGNPVNDSLYVDIEDTRIYICCPACSDEIVKNPAKYRSIIRR